MSAFWSAGFFSSISTSGRPLTNRMMSGRRVWCGPVMENWLTASHSLRAGSAQSTRRTKSPRVSPSCWYCTGTPVTSSRWNCRLAASSTGVPRSSTCLTRIVARRLRHVGVQRGDGLAQALDQQHLAVVGALGCGAVGRDVGAVAVLRSPRRPASPGFPVRAGLRSSALLRPPALSQCLTAKPQVEFVRCICSGLASRRMLRPTLCSFGALAVCSVAARITAQH